MAHHARKNAEQEQATGDEYQDEAPPANQEQAQPVPAPADPADQLEHLAQLHSSGALTDDEFAAAKAKILG